MKNLSLRLLAVVLAAWTSCHAMAQSSDVPYWASLDAEEVYMRVGPSLNYPIDWVYAREGLPVRVIRVNESWRLVEDPEGKRGWMSGGLLSRARRAIVTGEGTAAMRTEPLASAHLRWHLEPGVVGALGDCENGWCEFEVRGHSGWVEQSRLWGAGPP